MLAREQKIDSPTKKGLSVLSNQVLIYDTQSYTKDCSGYYFCYKDYKGQWTKALVTTAWATSKLALCVHVQERDRETETEREE